MPSIKQHLGFKFISLVLVLAMLTPTAVKIIHVFHHNYVECKEYSTHLHASDFDCSFHKFKLTTPFAMSLFSFDFFIPEHIHENTNSQYLYISDFQKLHFSLRGPPQINLI